MARERTPAPDADGVRAVVAPLMDGGVDAGAFFRVAGGRRPGLFGLLLWGPRQLARERQSGFGTFTYLAVRGNDLGAFELRWNPLRVHRTIGHWAVDGVDAQWDGDEIALALDDRLVVLEAAVPGPDATDLMRRLTSP